MIEVEVNVARGADSDLRDLISKLTGPGMAKLNEAGGRAAANAAVGFSEAFDAAGGWRNPTKGRSGASRFGDEVARGWAFLVADATGALIYNNATHYAFKVRGGTIKPKRPGIKHLTIPMIPEARDLGNVENYVMTTGRRLFKIPGKKALFEATGGGAGGKKSGVRAVFALVSSVTQAAMPEAVPPDDVIAKAFSAAWIDNLTK